MGEWRDTTLSEIANLNMGQSPKSEFYSQDNIGIPFLQGNRTFGLKYPYFDTYCSEPKKIANSGDILFSVRAPVGAINIANTEICIGRGLSALSAKNGNNDFLYFLLHYLKNEIINNESGSVFGSINKTDLGNIKVLYPPLEEQKAIAGVLSSLDDKIDLLHRQNKTLEALAQTFFRQWFIEEAGEGWEEKPLSEVTKIAIGRTPPRKEFHWFSKSSEDIKWVSIKDMGEDGAFTFSTSEYLTKEAVKTFNIPVIPVNTVLLSFKMTLGRVKITTEEMLSNEAIAHFKFHHKTPFNKEYLYLFLKTYPYEILGSTSSIVTSINSTMIKDMLIPIPDKNIIEDFTKTIEPQFNKIYSNQKQIKTLENLRDTLLPKLMSGEVRIKE